MSSHDSHDTPAATHHNVLPIPVYLAVYVALLVLMGLTIAASYVSLGDTGNLVLALVIAVTKAVLVVLFFMGVKNGTKLTWLWASIGFIWFLLLFGTLGDYVTRQWIHLPQGW